MSLIKKYFIAKKLVQEYYWIVGIPFLLLGIFLVMAEDEDINRNQNETYGMVYGSTPIHKQHSKRHYNYEFFYSGRKFTGSSVGNISDNIKKGSFYKVEFSDQNPAHSRMIFDLEYVRQFKTDNSGKVTDTIYIVKNQVLKNEIKNRLEKYKIELDTIKN